MAMHAADLSVSSSIKRSAANMAG
uniref:Uncharacterized protein n=1 Tax=Arundo donax TaxID=35708 RepID=A0A0A9ENX5_ARUDO